MLRFLRRFSDCEAKEFNGTLKKKKGLNDIAWKFVDSFVNRREDYFPQTPCAVCMGLQAGLKGAVRIPMTTVGLADKSTWCAAPSVHREMRFQITSKVTILINDPRTHSLLKLPLSRAHASVPWKRVL